MQVSLVPPDHIDICWDEISSHLGKSIGTAHGRYTMDDILKEAKSFEQHLWVVFDDTKIIAALTTRFDGLEMTGRNGFEKVLAPHGWTPEYVVFEKMFEENENG